MPDDMGELGDLGELGVMVGDAGRANAAIGTVRVGTTDVDVDLVVVAAVHVVAGVGVSGGVRGSVAGVMVSTGTSSLVDTRCSESCSALGNGNAEAIGVIGVRGLSGVSGVRGVTGWDMAASVL